MKFQKHINFLVILLAIMLTACNDESMSIIKDIEYSCVPVGFSCSENETTTRGNQTTQFANNSEFIVNARYYKYPGGAPTNFFLAQEVVLSGSPAQWTYSPVKYWPTTGEIDFYAYSPSTINGTLESLTLNHDQYPNWLLSYKVQAPIISSKDELTPSASKITAEAYNKAQDAENQQDVLLSVAPKQQCEGITINEKVKLSFIHPLAGLKLKFDNSYSFPTGTTNVILAIAPLCTGGTIAMNGTEIAWTLDESEATFYQGYTLTSNQIDTDNKTFFLPPQELKNFTIIARFYKKESDGTYTLLGIKSSNRNSLNLERGKTTTITLKN